MPSQLLAVGTDTLRHLLDFVVDDVVTDATMQRMRRVCRAFDGALCHGRTWACVTDWATLVSERRRAADWILRLPCAYDAADAPPPPPPPPRGEVRQVSVVIYEPWGVCDGDTPPMRAAAAALRRWLFAVPAGGLQTLHLHVRPLDVLERSEALPWYTAFVAPVVERFAAGCVDLCLSSSASPRLALARQPVPRRLLHTPFGFWYGNVCPRWQRTFDRFVATAPPRCRELAWIANLPCPPALVAAVRHDGLERLSLRSVLGNTAPDHAGDRWWTVGDGLPVPTRSLEYVDHDGEAGLVTLARVLTRPAIAAVPRWALTLSLRDDADVRALDELLRARRAAAGGRRHTTELRLSVSPDVRATPTELLPCAVLDLPDGMRFGDRPGWSEAMVAGASEVSIAGLDERVCRLSGLTALRRLSLDGFVLDLDWVAAVLDWLADETPNLERLSLCAMRRRMEDPSADAVVAGVRRWMGTHPALRQMHLELGHTGGPRYPPAEIETDRRLGAALLTAMLEGAPAAPHLHRVHLQCTVPPDEPRLRALGRLRRRVARGRAAPLDVTWDTYRGDLHTLP